MKKSILPMPLVYALLALMAFFILLPIYMVMVTALKDPAEISLATAWNLPSSPYWKSFSDAWAMLAPKMGNSFFLTFMGTLISAFLGSINGYVLSKWAFRGSNIIFALMLFGMFIPYQAVLIPLFEFISKLSIFGYELKGTIWGLILVHVVYGIPITTLIFKNYYSEVPDELVEAAKIDGAGFWSIYRNVILPISIPGFVVVIIWQFTQVWNEFLFAKILISSGGNQPITAALSELAGGEAVKWNLPMAGAMLAALPTLLVYILLGRYFIRGLLAGSVKG